MENGLKQLAAMSNRYGADADYVLAGGGNTSYKDEDTLYIKPSGVSLAEIRPEDFVAMNRELLTEMLNAQYPQEDEAREALALEKMMAAVRVPGAKRPSVETPLHNLFPYRFVLHIHPALVNGLTCGMDGKKIAEELFGDKIVWVDFVKPGYSLAKYCKDALEAQKAKTGRSAQILILQNHGIFYAADSVEEIDALSQSIMDALKARVQKTPSFAPAAFCTERAVALAPAIRMLASPNGQAIAEFVCNETAAAFAASKEAFRPLEQPFSPDHIVYCKAYPLFVKKEEELEAQYETLKAAWTAYETKNGYAPRVVAVEGLGFFVCGADPKAVRITKALLLDAMKVAVYSESFGGAHPMLPEFVDFIVHWEVESYRSKVSASAVSAKRLQGKIAVVTGGAQGFGEGIAQAMADQGAYLVVADLNAAGAEACAEALCAKNGAGHAIAAAANVAEEDSVKAMVEKTVLTYGGLDVFVSCAGIVRAGDLETMTKKVFELVTSINYTAYFLCAKYASAVMKIQHRFAPDYFMDIIEINSKSGLQGSSKNFAYAGSKFGGVGLTQSFAYELAPQNIKVNAVCPGNFYDGPLWSDPEKGLFRQYFETGKVPGAKSIEDVKTYYESKTPLRRGCRVPDVARAIFYIVEQEYETGQAVPVTGGQAMLN